MSAEERIHHKSGGIPRSRSEGNLIDIDERKPSTNGNITGGQEDLCVNWSDIFTQNDGRIYESTNPFREELSASNPFLDDIAQLRNNEKRDMNVSILKEDPLLFFREADCGSSFDSSGEDLGTHDLQRKPSARKCGRSKSVSEILDILDSQNYDPESPGGSNEILAHDMEWLQNDREAYKMAWLSHRQLARSCLDLGTMSQSPGWAQTQATDTLTVCRLDHEGGSVQLPESDITVHVPQGHVAAGEFQEVALRAFLEAPPSLNHDHSCTVSPLLEVTLSNLNTTEAILLEMKIAAEVKADPFSQVMTEIVCLHSCHKGGPFRVLNNCYVYQDTVQVKLTDLSRVSYLVAVVQAKAITSPATTVWDYIQRTISVGIYGPKYIHPSFTAVFTACGHNYMPGKLTIYDIKRGGKNTSPVVFQLWGKHKFVLDRPQDLSVVLLSRDPDFEVKTEDQRKEIKEEQLKAGEVVHRQFPFCTVGRGGRHLFVFLVQIEGRNHSPVTQFYITTPDPAPKLLRFPETRNHLQKRKEIKSAPLPLPTVIKYPRFQDRSLSFAHYAVTLKTVLRQSKVDYLLEYFKGDTIALLGGGKVKAIGQTKIKEWFVGVLRGRIGLVHHKNVKVISKEQVMSMVDCSFTSKKLLEQMAFPFKKLTYIYSAVLTLVSEKVYDWKALADALGYSHLSLEDFDQIQVDKESDRVAYVVKKLKEDCHADRNKRRFLYELVVALLKMDCQGLVAHLIQDTVILTSAVKLGKCWRELAEKLARLTKQQIEAYEVPHQGRAGQVALEMMWKPAYDFLYTWGAHYGDSYRDVLRDLQSALDKMKNPVTKQWRELTGALILVNCMEVLRANAFPIMEN
ncbi:metastasis-associated in colon cancer protein 1 [Ornithorhynchus anatinus]|uniref:Metastasis-associated in colon cancer protein 1 n=1 Tax=Ornithorhynchus anatinus TaxID=9258 RepID=A0A6I8P1G6_ORNAN|nr:metastasis-associated in colon cancer protein 1 [Ornithorhynchus anatinus]